MIVLCFLGVSKYFSSLWTYLSRSSDLSSPQPLAKRAWALYLSASCNKSYPRTEFRRAGEGVYSGTPFTLRQPLVMNRLENTEHPHVHLLLGQLVIIAHVDARSVF